MPALMKTTIKEQVYQIIKNKILYQEYALGEKINIDALAAELQVSNSPIREAIMLLEKDGLITTSPNNGARVVHFTENSYDDLANALYALLIGAYELCLQRNSTDEIIKNMRDILEKQKSVLETNDYFALVRYSVLFDKTIVTASGNEYLLSVYERLEDVFYLMILYNHQLGEDDRTRSIREHEMILDCILDKNSHEVRKWLRIHYDKHYESPVLKKKKDN